MLAAIQARERVARIAHAERVRIAALTAIVQGIWRERRRRRRERPRPDVDACVAYDCRRLERVQADLVPAARNLLVAGALKHWKGRRDAGAPAAALVGIVGKAAEGVRERREEGHDENVEVHLCACQKTEGPTHKSSHAKRQNTCTKCRGRRHLERRTVFVSHQSFHIPILFLGRDLHCVRNVGSLITQDSKNAVCAYGVCASGSLRFAVCSGTRSGTSEASNERRTARRQHREAQTPRLAPSR